MKIGKRARRIISLLIVCSMALALTGCTTYNAFRHTYLEESSEESMPVITIGVFEPQTGKNSSRGRDEIKGIELANSIYNNVDGYKVVLTIVDTQSQVRPAEAAIQGLISMQPVAIIGSAGDATSLAASAYIEEAGIPAITPSASNPLITQTNDYYFRACITGSQMGEGLAEYAYSQLGSNHIAIIKLKNDTATAALLDGFDYRIRKLAGKRSYAIRVETEINATEDEMAAALTKIQNSGCDACFVSLGTQSMDTFFSMVEERGLTNITFLGPRSWGESDFVSMMNKHPQVKVVFPYMSVISGTYQAQEAQTEEAQRFMIEYKARYGENDDPSEYAALGYDSYLLIINAIHSAKSLEGDDVRQALLGINGLKGATGVFSFDENGNVIRTVNLSTIRDGQIVSEYVTKAEAEAMQLEDVETLQDTEAN